MDFSLSSPLKLPIDFRISEQFLQYKLGVVLQKERLHKEEVAEDLEWFFNLSPYDLVIETEFKKFQSLQLKINEILNGKKKDSKKIANGKINAASNLESEKENQTPLVDLKREDHLLTFLDVDASVPIELSTNPKVQQILKEVDSLIGLKKIKEEFHNLVNQIEIQRKKENAGESVFPQAPFHARFVGNPGTGKTTVAKLYGRLLKELRILSKGDFKKTKASDFWGTTATETSQKTVRVLRAAAGCVLFIDEAYQLSPVTGTTDKGQITSFEDPVKAAVLNEFVDEIQVEAGEDLCVLMAGYEKEMKAFFDNANVGLPSRLQRVFFFDDYDEQELELILCSLCTEQNVYIERKVARKVIRDIVYPKRKTKSFGNARDVKICFLEALKRFQIRTQNDSTLNTSRKLCFEDFAEQSRARTKTAYATLKETTGWEELKLYIERIKALYETCKREKKDFSERCGFALNCAFVGPPGTGKTSAARLMGDIFHELGILPSNDFHEKKASLLVAAYVGQTGKIVNGVFHDAIGSVLFIDEAYALTPSGGSYNTEAINEMLQLLTEKEIKGKMSLILAGYENDINALIKSNEGFTRRIGEKIHFGHFTPTQCVKIFCDKMEQDERTFDHTASTKMLENFFEEAIRTIPSWSNAGDVVALYDAAFTNSILRDSSGSKKLSKEDLSKAFGKLKASRMPSKLSTPKQIIEAKYDNANEYKGQVQPVVASTIAEIAEEEEEGEEFSAKVEKSMVMDSLEKALAYHGYKTEEAALDALLKGDPVGTDLMNYIVADCHNRGTQLEMVEISQILANQKDPIVKRLNAIIEEKIRRKQQEEEIAALLAKKKLEEEEAARLKKLAEEVEQKKRVQEKLKKIGRCVQGYEWLRNGNGWRCAGGSHYVSDLDLK